ncbi:MAG TPA: HAMP domain-containing sensor histidine kinase [Longimicrobiales bacterium]|nr:HAMP domain-containing sensor histidine kinase [Longimicrobiales bacterium]
MSTIFARLIRPHSIERRLLLWLFIIALVPSLTVLAVASIVGGQASRWLGASGSWSQVAESGRHLIDEVRTSPQSNPRMKRAADEHARQLSTSLTQAGRWEFVGRRLRSLLPAGVVLLALMVALIALWAARRMSRSVSRPIRELVGWSALMAREQPLPPVTKRELGEVKELRSLRDALRNASEEMMAARARALEAERTRSWGEMARRVAHEMKNPLTPLRLASHRLQAIASSHPELNESVTVIEEETARLERLAARFAMLGRPTDGPRSAVDVADLLQRLLSTDVPAECKTKLLNNADDPVVQGDYNALLQAFRNLVRNAVEAVDDKDGRIEITLSDSAESVDIAIGDNGRGLNANDVARVFEPDFTSKPGGTGLGLAIARQIFRAHGGEITALARTPGAHFLVRLVK